jgi:hypothetical protein
VVPSITIIAIDKRQWLLKRLFLYTLALYKQIKSAEIVIINNAPSTELPALLISFFRPGKLVLCESDPLAQKAAMFGLYRLLHQFLLRRVTKTITLPPDDAYKHTEILPFFETDSASTQKREVWWQKHLNEITSV